MKASWLLSHINLDTKLFQLLVGERLGGAHYGRLTAPRHREGLHLTQITLASQVHDIAFDAQSDTAMRWCSIRKGVEHVSHALAYLCFAHPHHLVYGLEYLGPVRADRPSTALVSVADEVVLGREDVRDVLARDEPFGMLWDGHRERVVSEGPSTLISLLEEWEVDDPCVGQYSLLFLIIRTQVELISTILSHRILVGDTREWFLLDRVAHRLDHGRHHVFDGRHDILHRHEGHFDIHLAVPDAA